MEKFEVDSNIRQSFIRKQRKLQKNEDLEFMIREWEFDDRPEDDTETEYPTTVYTLYAFGVTRLNESVCLTIEGFTPYYYIKIPQKWNDVEAKRFIDMALSNNKSRWLRKYLVSHNVFRRKDAYGFNNETEFKFIRMVFSNSKAFKSSQWLFKNPISGYETITFPLYESNIDPMLVFMHLQNIEASGWVGVKSKFLQNTTDSRCQLNYSANWKNVQALEENIIPGLVTASYDIECFSWDGSFPNPSNLKNEITMIGTSFQRIGDDTIYKTVVVNRECDAVPGVDIIVCKNEYDTIVEWVKLLELTDPDQLIGYNIDGFDWGYIWKRAEVVDCLDVIQTRLGRLFHILEKFNESSLESSAYGYNSFNNITTSGVGQIDIMHWYKKNTKLDKYSLDFVATKFLKETKRDVSPQQIFDMSGPAADSKNRSIVAEYCAQDTNLPMRLMNYHSIYPNLIMMSRVTIVPLTWLITRGEQIKAFSQISKECRQNKFIIPANIKAPKGEYQGATVLNAERGIYFEPVSGLDFASLYPSIMIAHNLCITTLVTDPKYLGIEGVEYKDFKWDSNHYVFVQNRGGIIPGILKRLWSERKKYKKLMGDHAKGTLMQAIYNGQQLAIKLSMNSIYGVCGASNGFLSCQPIAECVTYTGRTMIAHSKECAEEWYDGTEKCGFVKAHVIYGDSVTGRTPITIKKNGIIQVMKIEDFTNDWKPFRQFKIFDNTLTNKEHYEIDDDSVEIMTANGFKKIKRIIRHKTHKRIYRVSTPMGIVEVTEDHSLIKKCGKLVTPGNVVLGEELMVRPIGYYQGEIV
jgi:DNA polymerase delta subunit 1